MNRVVSSQLVSRFFWQEWHFSLFTVGFGGPSSRLIALRFEVGWINILNIWSFGAYLRKQEKSKATSCFLLTRFFHRIFLVGLWYSGIDLDISWSFDCEKDSKLCERVVKSLTKRCCVCNRGSLEFRPIPDEYLMEHKEELDTNQRGKKWCTSCSYRFRQSKVKIFLLPVISIFLIW